MSMGGRIISRVQTSLLSNISYIEKVPILGYRDSKVMLEYIFWGS